jgi:Tfp pilus assembly PilM family ATPase
MRMALPFIGGASRKKRNQMMAVDLGTRTTKAVLMERRGEVLALSRYALLDAPIYDKKFSAELLSDHLRSVAEALGGSTKFVTLAVGLEDAIVRQVELPQIPVGEMRLVLKNNTKGYLQQDLPNHVFDCYIFPPKAMPAQGKPAEPAKPVGVPKLKVLVAGAKQQMVDDFQMAIKNAGLTAECIVPGIIGPVNAFEMAMPQIFANDSVALVDIGFKHSSICVLDRGELVLMRVVNIGGDKLTTGLAEAMNITYADAEGVKLGIAPKRKSDPDGEVGALDVQVTAFGAQVAPLGRELRASLDFFEHQQDRPVSQIFISGAVAKSEMFLEMLHAEMIAECKTWNPAAFLQLALPGQQAVEIEHVGPQLSVAIGAALAAL